MTDAAETADVAAARAETLIELDRHREAIGVLEPALALSPGDEVLLDLLARAQLAVEPRAALETALRLAAASPHSYRGSLLASLASDELGDTKAAERHAREAVAAAPWNAFAHAQLAQVLVGRRRRRKEALRAAEKAVELAPEEPVGYVTAGNVELGRGRPRQAAEWYRRALDVDPTNRAAQVNVALTHEVRDRLNLAFGDLDSILQLDPRDEDARRILDRTLYSMLVHLQWLVLALAFVVIVVRGE